MSNKALFRMPTSVSINGRSSSITNSFINGIVPCINPSEEEISTALSILGMNEETICCAYCGDKHTEWDHFRPLVENKRATGYITEIHNLVPACGKCNQSKGNYHWKAWMMGPAALSPATRGIHDIQERIVRLEAFEKWEGVIRLDFEMIVGKEIWEQYWDACEKLHEHMRQSQLLSNQVKLLIQNKFNKQDVTVRKENSQAPKPSGDKVGDIVKTQLRALLESGNIDSIIISKLQDKEYCKLVFDLNFPLLLKISDAQNSKKAGIISNADRYYSHPLSINNEWYRLTSQWYDKNKNKLKAWIARYS